MTCEIQNAKASSDRAASSFSRLSVVIALVSFLKLEIAPVDISASFARVKPFDIEFLEGCVKGVAEQFHNRLNPVKITS